MQLEHTSFVVSDDGPWVFIDPMPEAILLHHRGAVLLADDETAGMFGYERTEISGKLLSELLNQSVFRRGGESACMHLARGTRKDGTNFTVEILRGCDCQPATGGTMSLRSLEAAETKADR